MIKWVKQFKELNLDYLAYESRVFHFDHPQSFHHFFSPDSNQSAKEQLKTAEKVESDLARLMSSWSLSALRWENIHSFEVPNLHCPSRWLSMSNGV